jgi:hypothetical protein
MAMVKVALSGIANLPGFMTLLFILTNWINSKKMKTVGDRDGKSCHLVW